MKRGTIERHEAWTSQSVHVILCFLVCLWHCVFNHSLIKSQPPLRPCVCVHSRACESMHARTAHFMCVLFFVDEVRPYRNQTDTKYDLTSCPHTHHLTLPRNVAVNVLANQSGQCGCECDSCTETPLSFVPRPSLPTPAALCGSNYCAHLLWVGLDKERIKRH